MKEVLDLFVESLLVLVFVLLGGVVRDFFSKDKNKDARALAMSALVASLVIFLGKTIWIPKSVDPGLLMLTAFASGIVSLQIVRMIVKKPWVLLQVITDKTKAVSDALEEEAKEDKKNGKGN